MIEKNNANPFEIDFDSYILQSEPEKKENGKLWQTAIGLQQVDGLTPSKYLYETAKRNIDGEITIEEAKELIDSIMRLARAEQKMKMMKKKHIKFLYVSAKYLQRKLSALLLICYFLFINVYLQVCSTR